MDKWNLFLSTNVLLIDVLTTLNTPFCVITQYPQSKRKITCQKEKQCSVKLHDFSTFYVEWAYFLKGSLFMRVVS